MRIVLTGASGNVGTSVIDALQQSPEVDSILGLARRIPDSTQGSKVDWQAVDVIDGPLTPLFAGADAVIHLAWAIQPSRDSALLRATNVDGSRRVFEAVAQARVPSLIYASSVGAYSPGPPDRRRVDESWPTGGIGSSFYSRHKAEVELLLDRFEAAHPDTRVVRLRPALIFKGEAGSEIRRLFAGPFVPAPLLRADRLPILPWIAGLSTQAVHADDVGRAYALAATGAVRGPFNIAADPVLDPATIGEALGVRVIELPLRAVRGLAAASWRARLQPTPAGWVDMGMRAPLMSTRRAADELGWSATHSATETLIELLDGLSAGDGRDTPPLHPRAGGFARLRELASGIGSRD